MKEELMRISCAPECGFMVQSHEKKELIGIVKEHARKVHKMKATDSDLMGKMERV